MKATKSYQKEWVLREGRQERREQGIFPFRPATRPSSSEDDRLAECPQVERVSSAPDTYASSPRCETSRPAASSAGRTRPRVKMRTTRNNT